MGLEERSQRKNERGRTRGKYQKAEGIRSNRRGTIQEAAWRDLVQVYQREGRKAKFRKAIYPSLSLVYGTEAISPVELVVPTPRVVLEES